MRSTGRRYFVLAPREMSGARVRGLLKELLARRPVTFGVAEEEYVAGFEGQPQFKTLKLDEIKSLAEKSGGRVTLLPYKQKDVVNVVRGLDFDRAIVVNGSHHRSFHLRPEYEAIIEKGATVKYVSPFVDEVEARGFAEVHRHEHSVPGTIKELAPDSAIRSFLAKVASRAFITDFQTAALIMGVRGVPVAVSHNVVTPYETYAWHYGLSREKHKSPPGDSAHYDTVHAETAALMKAGVAAKGGKLYMQTFPCPHCARNIVFAGIREVIYELDYGDDYGYELFDKAGIKYRKFDEQP